MYPTKREQKGDSQLMLRSGWDLKPLSLRCPALREMLSLAAEKPERGEAAAAAHLKVADLNRMKRRNFTPYFEFHRICFGTSARVGRDSLLFFTVWRAKQKRDG